MFLELAENKEEDEREKGDALRVRTEVMHVFERENRNYRLLDIQTYR